MFTTDQGICGKLTLRLFKDSTIRDNWYKVASGFGGNYLIGDKWVASSEDPADVKAAQAKVGGEIK